MPSILRSSASNCQLLPLSSAPSLPPGCRYFYRAALVVWPRAWRTSTLCRNGIDGAVSLLAAGMAARETPADSTAFAAAIVDHIISTGNGASAGNSYARSHKASPESLGQLLRCAAKLASAGAEGAAGVVRRCLEEVFPGRLSPAQHARSICKAAGRLGWVALGRSVLGMAQRSLQMPQQVAAVAELVYALLAAARRGLSRQEAEATATVECVADMWEDAAVAACQLFATGQEQKQQQPSQQHGPLLGPVLSAMWLLKAAAKLPAPWMLPHVQQLLQHALGCNEHRRCSDAATAAVFWLGGGTPGYAAAG